MDSFDPPEDVVATALAEEMSELQHAILVAPRLPFHDEVGAWQFELFHNVPRQHERQSEWVLRIEYALCGVPPAWGKGRVFYSNLQLPKRFVAEVTHRPIWQVGPEMLKQYAATAEAERTSLKADNITQHKQGRPRSLIGHIEAPRIKRSRLTIPGQFCVIGWPTPQDLPTASGTVALGLWIGQKVKWFRLDFSQSRFLTTAKYWHRP